MFLDRREEGRRVGQYFGLCRLRLHEPNLNGILGELVVRFIPDSVLCDLPVLSECTTIMTTTSFCWFDFPLQTKATSSLNLPYIRKTLHT